MIKTRKLTFGLIYGLTGGLVFAVFALGVNAFQLARAHFAYPWLAFIPGLLLALALGGCAGTFSMWVENALLGAAAWLATGVLLGSMAVWLSLRIAPALLPSLEPVLKNWPLFSWLEAYSFYTTLVSVITGVTFLIVGLLETALVEQAAFSAYGSAMLMPVIVCSLAAGLAGGVTDNIVNERFRKSAIALDNLFSFAIENQGVEVDPQSARQIRLATVKPIESILSKDRRLFYLVFAEPADKGQILVDFNGQWAVCDVISEQPVFCRRAEPSP